MRQLIASLLLPMFIVGFTAPGASAGHKTSTSVALGLASFAVFSQVVAPFLHPRLVYAAPVYVAAPPAHVIYATQPQVVLIPPSPPPPQSTVIQYPHGRYELRGDGVTTVYHWVWIPNPQPSPPAGYQQQPSPSAAPPTSAEPCKPTGRYVKTPQGLLPECE